MPVIRFSFFAILILIPILSNSAVNEVTVGVAEVPPLVYTGTSGNPDGFFIDILKYVAKKEKWNLSYRKGNLGQCLKWLETNEIDIIADLGYSGERAGKYEFTKTAVISTWAQVYVPGNKKDIKTFLDLNDKRVIVERKDYFYLDPDNGIKRRVKDFGIKCSFIEVDEYSRVLEELEKGNGDAGILNRIYGEQYSGKYSVKKTDIMFAPVTLHYAFQKNNPGSDILRNVIDQYLVSMKDDKGSVYYDFLARHLPETKVVRIPLAIKLVLLCGAFLIFVFILLIRIYRLTLKNKLLENLKLKGDYTESEEKYRKLIEENADGILVADVETKMFTYANPAICEILGYSKEELSGMGVYDIHPKESLEYVLSRFESQAKSKITLAENIPCVKKNGDILYFDINTTPVVIDGKKSNIGVFRDITRQREAEISLKQSEANYRDLYDKLPEYCYLISPEGIILDVNKKVLDTLGYAKEELVGALLQKIYAPESVAKMNIIFEKWKNTGNLENEEVVILTKMGLRRTVLLNVTSIRGNNGNIIHSISVQRDITEQKKLEQQLLQSQKMEAIGSLAGGVAHDFNNLLTSILGNVSLAMNEIKEGSTISDDLKEVKNAATRAAALTRQLLLYSRKQPMGLFPVNINNTINSLIVMVKRLIGEDAKIIMELNPGIGTVMADESNIEQVITNLCINAKDAMPDGGTITIKTENFVIDEEQGKLAESRPGAYVRLSMADTGIGMDKETIKHIFEPFYTTKGIGKGTGLGLSVVYGIIKAHNGWITVYSEPGEGSVFNIYLPSENRKAGIKSKNEVKPMNLKEHDEGVLVVEDDESVLAYTKKLLAINGYSVFEATNSTEAIEVFKNNARNIDLVITDMILPDKTGLELAGQLRLLKDNIPVIVCSGYLDNKSKYSEIKEKGYGYIQKPFEINEILKVIKETIES